MTKRLLMVCLLLIAWKNSFSQVLHLVKPDTTLLKIQEEKSDYAKSLGYLYLVKYYNIHSPQNNIKSYDGTKKNCSFDQNFGYGIKYSSTECIEGGGHSETFIFPNIDVAELKKLINVLFYNPLNKWVTPLKYEPEEAGCYYEIKKSVKGVVLEVYCGC